MINRRRGSKSGRRDFLRTTAAAGAGLAVTTGASAQSASPSDLRLGQLRLIDLSVSLVHDAPGERTKPKIDYVTHADAGLKSMMDTFGAKPDDFVYSNGHGWAVENLTVSCRRGHGADKGSSVNLRPPLIFPIPPSTAYDVLPCWTTPTMLKPGCGSAPCECEIDPRKH